MEWKSIGVQDARGKTVKATISPCGEEWLFFTDGTLLVLSIEHDEIVARLDDTNPLKSFSHVALLELGLVTQEEIDVYKAAVKASKEADKLRLEQEELRAYTRLKQKFERGL